MCNMIDNNLYNVGFLLWGEWTDDEAANNYLTEIDSLDDQRYAEGSRLTLIYLNGGIVALCLALTYICMLIARCTLTVPLSWIGMTFGVIFWTFNISTIIMIGVFRFSAMGKLAALSTCPAVYDEDASKQDYYLSNSRTYSDNIFLVTVIWICQIFAFLSHCVYFAFMCRKSSKEKQDRTSNQLYIHNTRPSI